MFAVFFVAKPCCERSEPTSAKGAVPRVWGAESPPRSAVNEHPAGCLFNRENLALQKLRLRFVLRLFSASVAVEDALPETFAGHRAGYKEDISKTKSGYKVDTIVSSFRMLTKSTDWQSVEKARKPRKQTCIQGSLHRRK